MSNENPEDHGSTPVRNALADYAGPKLDLVGPTVDDDIQRAIVRYGEEAVKAAVKNATKPKRGRKAEPDWPELRAVFHADALVFLSGGDPFKTRSIYSIAKDFAERNPGQSPISTHKRIERKLTKGPYERRWWTLVTAESISRTGFPFAVYLRALEALSELPPESKPELWAYSLDRAKTAIADYEEREGNPPPANMSFRAVEFHNSRRSLEALAKPKTGGLFGLSKPATSLGGLLAQYVEDGKD